MMATSTNELADMVTAAIRPGNAVMIKGSLGSRMKTVVERLEKLDQAKSAVSATGGK